jgi:hypothetical protein
MKRFSLVLLIGLMVLAGATPISAKQGGEPGPPDQEDNAPVSVTCDSPWWTGDYKVDDFDIVLTKDSPDACVDVLSGLAGEWVATVTGGPDTLWTRPELMMVPRDAAFPSDSCGGIKRVGDSVFEEWRFPPPDDARGFDIIPAATVNACPGNDAVSVGGEGVGEWGELVEREGQDPESIFVMTPEQHPLAFVVWSHNLRKGESISIHVDLPPLGE